MDEPTTQSDALIVLCRLVGDGLQGLSTILHKHGACIAGSYVVPWYETKDGGDHIPDIDIWVPYTEDADTIIHVVAALTSFLYTRGYKLPRVSYASSPSRTCTHRVPNAYKRIQQMIDQIICFRGVDATRRHVQVIVMRKAGGASPASIIRHFDLTIVQRYFDGVHVWSTPRSTNDVESRLLCINSVSDIIKNQTFPEWIRTLTRIQKYSTRGYAVSGELVTFLLSCIPRSIVQDARIVKVLNRPGLPRAVNSVNMEVYMHKWNTLSGRIQWPGSEGLVVTLTVCPPGVTMQEVHVCMVCTESTLPVAWSLVPEGQRRALLPRTTTTNDCRTIYWNKTEHLISTLTPFPSLDQVLPSAFIPDIEEVVYDHIMLEERKVGEYIEEDIANHLIVYDTRCTPCTLTREQIRNAKVYLPCRKKYSADHLNVDVMHKAIVTVSTMMGTFFVPSVQMYELLQVSASRRFQLVPTDILWDCSTVFLHSAQDREDAQSYIGGITNNGGPYSHKRIHFIRRLP